MSEALIDISEVSTFGQVLGGLMDAVLDAQRQANLNTIEYIESMRSQDDPSQLEYLSFTYQKNNALGEPGNFSIKVPYLGLVDIPAINIKTAKFSFYYDVTETPHAQTKETTLKKASKGSGKIQPVFVKEPPKLIVGRVSKTSNVTSNIEKNAGIKVDIEFEKSPMAISMERIMDILELAAKDEDLSKYEKKK